MGKSKNSKSNFCIRPFNSVDVDAAGAIKVCCVMDQSKSEFHENVIPNIKDKSIKEWWNSEYLQYLRQSFLQNKKPKECSECWIKEDSGLRSFRLRSNEEHRAIFQNKFEKNLKLIGKDNLLFPEDVQISITNLCNLKCQMCSGVNSSRLLIENNALGYENLSQEDYNLDDAHYQKIEDLANHDISLLKLLGGEPLFNPKVIKLLELLVKNEKAHSVKLHITTNATVCNDKILDLLRQFKELRLVLSIDGTGKCEEYMRYPSSWEVVKSNVDKFKSLPNAYTYINTVVQNLNVLYVHEVINFAYNENIYIKLDILIDPDHLYFLNLPKQVLKQAHKNLSSIANEKLTHTENVQGILKLLEDRLQNYSLVESKYRTFVDMVNKRDNYRKINIEDYMPELAREIVT